MPAGDRGGRLAAAARWRRAPPSPSTSTWCRTATSRSSGEVTARLSWDGGHHGWRWQGDVAADACARAGTVSFVVPDAPGPLTLDLDLVAGDVAATNRYVSVIRD